MNDPWASFWPDLLKNVVTLLIGGLIFTVAWGLVAGRRESLNKHIEMLTGWFDEWAGSMLHWFHHLRRAVDQNLMAFAEEEAQLRSAAKLDDLSARTFSAMTRIQRALNAAAVFDSSNIRVRMEAVIRTGEETQEALVNVDPFRDGARARLAFANERLAVFLSLANDLTMQMIKETDLASTIRHYCRQLVPRTDVHD